MALAVGVVVAAAFFPAGALAAHGGIAPTSLKVDFGEAATASTPTPGSTECATDAGGARECLPVAPANLVHGIAAPPESAPPAVKAAIAAANRIHTRPYVWGGGHGHWWDRGYDCSGAVSYALHGAGLIKAPMDSGEMMGWGVPGKGRWITIYANAGHAFAVIDGLRWDTVGDRRGTGPRWHSGMVSSAGFVARHPAGY